jgi:hypothetical protein
VNIQHQVLTYSECIRRLLNNDSVCNSIFRAIFGCDMLVISNLFSIFRVYSLNPSVYELINYHHFGDCSLKSWSCTLS